MVVGNMKQQSPCMTQRVQWYKWESAAGGKRFASHRPEVGGIHTAKSLLLSGRKRGADKNLEMKQGGKGWVAARQQTGNGRRRRWHGQMSGLMLGLVAHLGIVVGRQPCLFPNLERSTIGEVGSCEFQRTNSGVVPLRWEIKSHNWVQQCPKPMSESLLSGQEVLAQFVECQ